MDGWILDLYPCPQGMTLWLLTQNQTRHRLIDAFSPAFYVHGPEPRLHRLEQALATQPGVTSRFTERINLWENRAMTALEVSVQDPTQFRARTYWVHRFDAALPLFNSDLMLASVYCWQRRIFPLAHVEVETDEAGCVRKLECRDDEWKIGYELPPFEIMRLRLGGLSRIDPQHDLIRIWTTDGIARWFSELALVEQSMRDSIVALERAGRRPDQMAITLRAHSDLLLTARNKSAMALIQQDSWSGEHPQTVLLPLSDPAKLQANRALADGFISELSPSLQCHGGLLVRDVTPEAVCAFLRSYKINEDIIAFRSDQLADWIMERSAVSELTDWSIFIASPQAGRQATIGGQEIGLVRRNRISSESIGILTDPRHEGVDLPGGPDAYKRQSGAYDADMMRAARPSTQGLLIIYPLDAETLGVDYTDAVIALALSLPDTSDAGTSWIVNSMVSRG